MQHQIILKKSPNVSYLFALSTGELSGEDYQREAVDSAPVDEVANTIKKYCMQKSQIVWSFPTQNQLDIGTPHLRPHVV